jgi:hypothetical protein
MNLPGHESQQPLTGCCCFISLCHVSTAQRLLEAPTISLADKDGSLETIDLEDLFPSLLCISEYTVVISPNRLRLTCGVILMRYSYRTVIPSVRTKSRIDYQEMIQTGQRCCIILIA